MISTSLEPGGHRLPSVLTVDEAAALMRIGRNTCYAACRSGEVPCMKIGTRVLISTEALLLKLSGNATVANPAQ